MLDSLVRVSRRAAYSHYASILAKCADLSPGWLHDVSPIRLPRKEVRDRDLYPTAQTDAGLPAEECTGQKPG